MKNCRDTYWLFKSKLKKYHYCPYGCGDSFVSAQLWKHKKKCKNAPEFKGLDQFNLPPQRDPIYFRFSFLARDGHCSGGSNGSSSGLWSSENDIIKSPNFKCCEEVFSMVLYVSSDKNISVPDKTTILVFSFELALVFYNLLQFGNLRHCPIAHLLLPGVHLLSVSFLVEARFLLVFLLEIA